MARLRNESWAISTRRLRRWMATVDRGCAAVLTLLYLGKHGPAGFLLPARRVI